LKGSLRGNERKAEKHVLRALMTFGVMRAQNLLKKPIEKIIAKSQRISF
jgi:hypothetical protein